MSWKFGVEGLLYYETTGVWRRSDPDPWRDPEAFPTAYGDGFLFYPSREAPVEIIRSIRLEVIRDGIEDYDYFAILRGLVAEAERKTQWLDADLLETARRLLQVPDMIVATTSSFTDSPPTLLRRRAQLGNCISRLRLALASH
jgi:hypothetical protein